jgi:hypothetical protein
VAEILCDRCQRRNPLGSNFCSSCGAPLTARSDDTTALLMPVAAEEVGRPDDPGDISAPVAGPEPEPDEVTGAALVVSRGPDVGARVPLGAGVTTLGRHPDSTIFLDDITVSRRHAEIAEVEGGHEVRDAGSLNGTYVNRRRVEQALLQPGDELQIGKFKLIFVARQGA